jgi:hypothetical protein
MGLLTAVGNTEAIPAISTSSGSSKCTDMSAMAQPLAGYSTHEVSACALGRAFVTRFTRVAQPSLEQPYFLWAQHHNPGPYPPSLLTEYTYAYSAYSVPPEGSAPEDSSSLPEDSSSAHEGSESSAPEVTPSPVMISPRPSPRARPSPHVNPSPRVRPSPSPVSDLSRGYRSAGRACLRILQQVWVHSISILLTQAYVRQHGLHRWCHLSGACSVSPVDDVAVDCPSAVGCATVSTLSSATKVTAKVTKVTSLLHLRGF